MRFLGNLIASILGTFIALGIFFLFFVVVIAAMSETEDISIKTNSVLEINLEKLVKDYAPKSSDPVDMFFGFGENKMGLNEIINAIENAKYDDNIQGISIVSNGVNAGIAQTQAIRKKLEEFKETGKFIKAYADVYDQKTYYLSSIADSVFVNPLGSVDFKGLSSEVLFFKDLEDKTGISMEVIRHGKYKGAVEPFLYNEMSDENRTQISEFLNSLWDEMISEISVSRKISKEMLNAIADNLLARNAILAIENKIVDQAIYLDEYNNKLKMATGISIDKDLNKVKIEDYIAVGKGRITSVATNQIAVIYAQGEIIYGKGDEDNIGQELIIEALQKARNTTSVKGIVLRIDSPGGSALASELIWREIELTKREMPIVVSMGNMAASGGYYLACNADRIFAESTTITGSIGVFGIIPNVTKLAEKIGVNAEQVSTNKSAKYSAFEPMSSEFRAVTTEGVEQVYSTFLKRVASGRNMTEKEVDSVAQGRVWSGKDAIKKGLVDEIGTIENAVSHAAELAGITEYKIRNYPNYNIELEDRLKGFPFAQSKEKLLKEELGEANYKIYQNLKSVSTLEGIQARMPFVLEIK
ncbi:signal peptide peptidase SppA [Lutibacter sp.]|uniref:signal peptide peptidase SppA n=1 Tax=Lutibacter sp. TaxID=1925666 RepID=UPI00273570C1|nr:signal peptide peptidase SppA [Lutibacter sp.]MDP3313410.1 signal peptide peptidase SppA [Lutibacter sp.]